MACSNHLMRYRSSLADSVPFHRTLGAPAVYLDEFPPPLDRIPRLRSIVGELSQSCPYPEAKNRSGLVIGLAVVD